MKFMKQARYAVPAALLSPAVFAQATFDTTGPVADINAGIVAIAAIAAVGLTAAIVLKVWKMLRRAA